MRARAPESPGSSLSHAPNTGAEHSASHHPRARTAGILLWPVQRKVTD
jgi:hypothetical protein